MSTFLMLLAVFLFGAGLWGLVMGRVRWMFIGSRKTSAGVILGSLFTLLVGAAVSPAPTTAAAPISRPVPAVTVTVTAAPVTVTPPAVTVTATPVSSPSATPQPTASTKASTGTTGSGSGSGGSGTVAKTTAPKSTAPKTTAPKTTAAKAPASVYYKNCDAARAAGAAPVRRGDPGYAAHLDRDSDGVGCE